MTGSAINLRKVEETAPALVSLYKSAGVSLRKYGMEGGRAAVYLVLDYSGSMKPYYADGSVQALADRVLGLSAHLDDDARVPVVFFSTEVDAVEEISLAGHEGRVTEIASRLGHMGKTAYHAAMDAVIDHYLDSGSTSPPWSSSRPTAGRSTSSRRKSTCARRPGCRSSGSSSASATRAARSSTSCSRLDELPVPAKRAVDNAGYFHAGQDPRRVPDGELYDRLVSEFPAWLAAARGAGIVRA